MNRWELKKIIGENPQVSWFVTTMMVTVVYLSVYIAFPGNQVVLATQETGWVPPLMWICIYIVMFSFAFFMMFSFPKEDKKKHTEDNHVEMPNL